MPFDVSKYLDVKERKIQNKINICSIVRWIIFFPIALAISSINYLILYYFFGNSGIAELTSFYIFTLYSIIIAPRYKRIIALIFLIVFILLETVGLIEIAKTEVLQADFWRSICFISILFGTALYTLITKKISGKWLPWVFGFCSGILGVVIIVLHTFLAYKFFKNDLKKFVSEFEYIQNNTEEKIYKPENVILKKRKTKKNFFSFLKYRWLKYKRNQKQKKSGENKKMKMPNFKLSQNVTFIIIALIVGFSYIFVEQNKINYKEKLRQEEKISDKIQQDAYESCMINAEADYISLWNTNCHSKNLKDDCSLPLDLAQNLENSLKNNQKICLDKLKNKAFKE